MPSGNSKFLRANIFASLNFSSLFLYVLDGLNNKGVRVKFGGGTQSYSFFFGLSKISFSVKIGKDVITYRIPSLIRVFGN